MSGRCVAVVRAFAGRAGARRIAGGRGRGGTGRLHRAAAVLGLVLALTVISRSGAGAASGPVDLGTAANFAVLAGSTVTSTGLSIIGGELGVSAGTAVTGFPPGVVTPPATIHSADAAADQAQVDLTAAYGEASLRSPSIPVTGDLGGQLLGAGVYSAAALDLNGTLTLDADGDANAVFVFQAGTSLLVGPGASVLLSGEANICNVFWQVGTAATLGETSALVGTVMAQASITANTGASVAGRLLARDGAVTLDSNVVTAPTCSAVPPTTTTTTTTTTTPTTTSTTTTTAAPTTTTTTPDTTTTTGPDTTTTTTGVPDTTTTTTTAVPDTTTTTPDTTTTAASTTTAAPDTTTTDPGSITTTTAAPDTTTTDPGSTTTTTAAPDTTTTDPGSTTTTTAAPGTTTTEAATTSTTADPGTTTTTNGAVTSSTSAATTSSTSAASTTTTTGRGAVAGADEGGGRNDGSGSAAHTGGLLAFTGFPLSTTFLVGVLAVALGVALVLMARRAQRATVGPREGRDERP